MLHSYGDPAFFAAFFCTNSTELVRVSVKFAASTMVKTEYSRNELHVFEAKCKRGSHVAFLPAWGKKKALVESMMALRLFLFFLLSVETNLFFTKCDIHSMSSFWLPG